MLTILTYVSASSGLVFIFHFFYSLSLGTFLKICQFTQEMYSSWFLILSHFQLKNILKHLSMIQECILAKFIVGFRGFVQLGGMV